MHGPVSPLQLAPPKIAREVLARRLHVSLHVQLCLTCKLKQLPAGELLNSLSSFMQLLPSRNKLLWERDILRVELAYSCQSLMCSRKTLDCQRSSAWLVSSSQGMHADELRTYYR